MITSELIKKCSYDEIIGNVSQYTSVSTDSRKTVANEIFIALFGIKFDGADYAFEVAKSGAGLIVLNSSDKNIISAKKIWSEYKIPVLLTKDTLCFLQELATFYRKEWIETNKERRIIGITGSNGKTTHKEMLYHLLNEILPNKVLATAGNFNNHIGVPLTILKLTNKHQVAIIEMGMNHPGEIKPLCEIAGVDSGIITNIGHAHVEFMGDQEGIFKEKRTLFDYVFSQETKAPLFTLCEDDHYLRMLPKLVGVTFFGENSQDVALEINGEYYNFKFNENEISLNLKSIFGKHNKKNMLACFLLGLKMFPDKLEKLKLAVLSYKAPDNNRSQWIIKRGRSYFLDAYNANPSSMLASLMAYLDWMKTEQNSLNDCLMILGDMNELGIHTEKLHKEIGEWMVENGFKNVIYVGRFSHFYLKGDPTAKSYVSTDLLKKDWKNYENNFKFFFLKGSRTVQLEGLLENSNKLGH